MAFRRFAHCLEAQLDENPFAIDVLVTILLNHREYRQLGSFQAWTEVENTNPPDLRHFLSCYWTVR